MKLSDSWTNYRFYTSKLSDVLRQYALGAIALIWAFRETLEGKNIFQEKLRIAAALIIAGFMIDILQYTIQSITWHKHSSCAEDRYEKNHTRQPGVSKEAYEEEMLKSVTDEPFWLNRFGEIAFYIKTVVFLAGSFYLLIFLLSI